MKKCEYRMNIGHVLDSFGVCDDTLTADEMDFLDAQGYLPLPGVLTQTQIETFTARLQELAAEEGEAAGSEVHQEEGTIRLSNLINKDPVFDLCFIHPRILAGINRVLSCGFRVHSLNARFALPGKGAQALHMDWGSNDPQDWEKLKAKQFYVCNSIWLLSDFTAENGATRVVPGSHLRAQAPADEMDDPTQPAPDEEIVTAPAGTVVVFNSHTWHGGTLNRSKHMRGAMHMAFVRRDWPQQTDQRKFLRPATEKRLSPEARFLLDV